MSFFRKCTGCSTKRTSPTTPRITENRYNIYIESIINSFHANRKSKKEELEKTFNDIRTLVGATRTNFFIKSFYIQSLYVDTFDGFSKLEGNSANCKFQIADVTLNQKTLKFFYKIVKYESQNRNIETKRNDLLLYDVVNSVIIEKIIHKNNEDIECPTNSNIVFKLRNHFPKYISSSLSFYKTDSHNSYWDYNIIKYTNPISPYSYKTVIDNSSTIYKDKCMLICYNAINMISFEKVFKNYINDSRYIINKTVALRALIGYVPLINAIIYLGVLYGFMHNDLHSGNVVFNLETNYLMIIDYGRASFKKYIDTSTENINNLVKYNVCKLGYDDIYPSLSLDDYPSIYSHKPLFNHRLSSSIQHEPSFYFGFIFDIITITLNIYIKTLVYFNREHTSMMLSIYRYLRYIIYINYDSTIDRLISNYNFSISTSHMIDTVFSNYRECKREISNITDPDINSLFNELTDNLLITALFLHSRNLHRQPIIIDANNPHSASPFYWALQIVDKSCKIQDFYTYMDTLYQHVQYHDDLDNIKYFKNIFKYRGSTIRGGDMKNNNGMKTNDNLDDNDNYFTIDIFKNTPKGVSNFKTTNEIIKNYVNIYELKDKYSYYDDKEESFKMASKRSLKNYKVSHFKESKKSLLNNI